MKVTHGGIDEVELRGLGIDPAEILDLSANLHPSGASSSVIEAAREARLDRYPSARADALRDAIAEYEGLPARCVLPTAGATAALHLLARALLEPGDTAVVFPPAFGEYEAAARSVGARVHGVVLTPPLFAPPEEIPAGRVVFVANPNNPTGVYLRRDVIERWAEGLDGVLVVDAAYEAFVEDHWNAAGLVRRRRNVLVVRSMTKLHAIPGVRLGYVLGVPGLIERMEALQPSWSLDAVAQAVGPVALAEHEDRVALLREMWPVRERLRVMLEATGAEVSPSRANFLLAEVGDGTSIRRALLERGILVRDCGSFGLPGWIRIAVPPAEHEARVTDAIREVLA